jgi:hypothetical protein
MAWVDVHATCCWLNLREYHPLPVLGACSQEATFHIIWPVTRTVALHVL